MAEPGLPSTPPGLGAPEGEVLAEQGGGQCVEEAGQRRILDDPAPQRIDHCHPAASGHLQESGHTEEGIGPELDRVAPLVVDPPDDHVDRVEAAERAEPHAVVGHDQVAPLDE